MKVTIVHNAGEQNNVTLECDIIEITPQDINLYNFTGEYNDFDVGERSVEVVGNIQRQETGATKNKGVYYWNYKGTWYPRVEIIDEESAAIRIANIQFDLGKAEKPMRS